jgi:hypothetical protein
MFGSLVDLDINGSSLLVQDKLIKANGSYTTNQGEVGYWRIMKIQNIQQYYSLMEKIIRFANALKYNQSTCRNWAISNVI